ncbi:hypothetical protein ACHAW6_008761 [Cyclotella cf. meneghiniana]
MFTTPTFTTATLPPHHKCTDCPQFTALHYAASTFRNDDKMHLKHLLADAFRCQGLLAVHSTSAAFERGFQDDESQDADEGFDAATSDSEAKTGKTNKNFQRRIILDYSRQQITGSTLELLFDLADRMGLNERMSELRCGYHINYTERKAVLHHLLRTPRHYDWSHKMVGGKARMDEVWDVLTKIRNFSVKVRNGTVRGITGKLLKNVVCLTSGGMHYGPEAVYEALSADRDAFMATKGRDTSLSFISNVDPVDFDVKTRNLQAEETLFIVISKSFEAVETMYNARMARRWLKKNMCKDPQSFTDGQILCDFSDKELVEKHFCAVTADCDQASQFGIHSANIYPMFDWVGERFSVWSAAGMLPLSIHYSYKVMQRMLEGAHDIDEHFFDAPLGGNIPVLLGLLGVWNSTFMGYHARALLPYSHALSKFPAVVQKFDMESNGKRVSSAGIPLLFSAGEIDFGECGINGQYNFYQLLHQGRTIPSDFIGFMESQSSAIDEEYNENQDRWNDNDGWDAKLVVNCHDELMSNFFSQPDALALGKTLNDLVQEEVPEELREHKVFPGNKPSSSILMTKLDAFAVGQLFAIYEHRTVVQGFIWGINSFDQYGTELGRMHAKRVRAQLSASRKRGASVQGFNFSSGNMLEAYLSHGRASR